MKRLIGMFTIKYQKPRNLKKTGQSNLVANYLEGKTSNDRPFAMLLQILGHILPLKIVLH